MHKTLETLIRDPCTSRGSLNRFLDGGMVGGRRGKNAGSGKWDGGIEGGRRGKSAGSGSVIAGSLGKFCFSCTL